jgi:hypothetical protein
MNHRGEIFSKEYRPSDAEVGSSVGPAAGSAMYIPQLLEAKLDQERPFVCMYSDKKGIQQLKAVAERVYMKHRFDHERKLLQRLRQDKKEKKRLKRLHSTANKKDREETKKLISAVNKVILDSPRFADDASPDILQNRAIVHLQRPTFSYTMGKKCPDI